MTEIIYYRESKDKDVGGYILMIINNKLYYEFYNSNKMRKFLIISFDMYSNPTATSLFNSYIDDMKAWKKYTQDCVK